MLRVDNTGIQCARACSPCLNPLPLLHLVVGEGESKVLHGCEELIGVDVSRAIPVKVFECLQEKVSAPGA